VTIKSDLLESDFSMCLANLLNYPEPKVPEDLLKYAAKIKEKLTQPNYKQQYDFFGQQMNLKQ
jgi:hypothetical protein